MPRNAQNQVAQPEAQESSVQSVRKMYALHARWTEVRAFTVEAFFRVNGRIESITRETVLPTYHGSRVHPNAQHWLSRELYDMQIEIGAPQGALSIIAMPT